MIRLMVAGVGAGVEFCAEHVWSNLVVTWNKSFGKASVVFIIIGKIKSCLAFPECLCLDA